MGMDDHPVVIIGAGPAGLTAAYELVKRNIRPIVVEKANIVGGLARTEIYKGYRFDLGGHRFFTKIKEVKHLWQEMLNENFLKVHRLSRIHHQGHFINYPINLFNVISNFGIFESVLILLSYLKTKLRPYPEEETFEQWVTNRFGSRLYKTFFQSYTEKVWGIPCHMIQSDWAAQRIKGLSLISAVSNALFRSNHIKTLVNEFHYPVLGAGMMWQHFQKVVESLGGEICLNTEIIRLRHEGYRIKGITAQQKGKLFEISGTHFISTMPLNELLTRLEPPPPKDVIKSAHKLNYRASILVGIILDKADLFQDQWIYVHNPEVRVGRIQNYKNWSIDMVPDPTKTSLGMEYFCTEGDAFWAMSDDELLDLATRELTRLGLAHIADVKDGVVFRQPKAYPVYDRDYRKQLKVVQQFIETINDLQTIGRNGLHCYNNQDQSMLTAMLAVKNLFGENNDLWSVNTEQFYHEEFTA